MSALEELTLAQLETAWEGVKKAHKKYLARHEVVLPSKASHMWVWLAVLFHFKGRCVHKDYISSVTRRVFPAAGADQQVRHLKRSGWRIDTDGCGVGEHKLNPYEPHPSWVNEQARRSARVGSAGFSEFVESTGGQCFSCGAEQGAPHPRYGDDRPVLLQQGHMDPNRPAADLESVIPQCQYCNRSYKNDFTFDRHGRVRAVASPAAVKRASASVRRAIFEELRKEFGS